MRQLITFMFGSRVGFLGTADRTAAILKKKSNGHISETRDPIHFLYEHRLALALYRLMTADAYDII